MPEPQQPVVVAVGAGEVRVRRAGAVLYTAMRQPAPEGGLASTVELALDPQSCRHLIRTFEGALHALERDEARRQAARQRPTTPEDTRWLE